jgi:hypothetical protein
LFFMAKAESVFSCMTPRFNVGLKNGFYQKEPFTSVFKSTDKKHFKKFMKNY